MAVITAITPSPRREGRFDLEVDGARIATLSLDAIERLGLRTGAPFIDQTAAAVAHEAGVLHTFDRALDMLAARARAARELRLLLLKKREPESFVDAAIQRLRALGYLDDATFARQFVRAKMVGARLSKRRLQSELARRGVPHDVVDAAIREVMEEEVVDPDALIEALARKKLGTLGRLDPLTQRRRLYGYLARRGYDPDAIRRVMSSVLAAEEDRASE